MASRTYLFACLAALFAVFCYAEEAAAPLKWADVLSAPDAPFDNNGDNFDILTKLAVFADLAETITTAEKVTVFAPTDASFVRLARAITSFNGTSEAEAFDALVAVVTAGVTIGDDLVSGKDLVAAILKYHVSPHLYPSTSVLGHPALLHTLLGTDIITVGNGELVDMSPSTPNPVVATADLAVENGVIVHVIDFVLLPVALPLQKTCV